jgi:hypothetical protein
MPYVSAQKLADLTDCLRFGTYPEKLTALQRTPISPPNGSLEGVAAGPRSGQGDWSKFKIGDVDQMVAYIKLLPASSPKEGAVTFDVKLPNQRLTRRIIDAYSIPCWWLPWQSKRFVKLKIADATQNGGQLQLQSGLAMPNPDLFFTAALSGCSVFAVGVPRSPSVYHVGFDPDNVARSAPLAQTNSTTTEEFFAAKLGRPVATGLGVPAPVFGLPVATGVGKSEYVAELRPGFTSDTDRVGQTTRRALALEAQLRASGRFTSIDHKEFSLSPWGTVFGLRDAAGSWIFELVKNASTRFYRMQMVATQVRDKSRVPFGRGKTRTAMASHYAGQVQRPILGNRSVDGETDVSLGEPREMAIGVSVTLGHKRFFPGVGRTQYVALSSNRITSQFA